LLETDIDVVLMASPPYFRPEQVEAAVHAGKHIFQEKPIAVDPVGARRMDETTQLAKEKGLCMVSGTIRRYQRDYIATHDRVSKGAIGEVTGATIIRNGGALWWVERRSEWSDLEYMMRNWGNYLWLSGDHIVEMFIHEVDVMSWYMGDHPAKATGYGGRSQRAAGDLFDHFSFSLDYGGNRRVHCAVRQIDGCSNGKEELIQGTEGSADAAGVLYDKNGERIWRYPHPRDRDEDQSWSVPNPYIQEHVELVTAIRTGNYVNDSDEQVKSTRIGIMATMAAYTGQDVTWDEVLESDLKYEIGELSFASRYDIPKSVPQPGVTARPIERYA
jgi:myo-inositol 2-dehydrogenase / D-chiro-inositol 1-dehydrogenase